MDCEIAKPSALRMFTVRVTRVVSYSLEFPFLLDVQRLHGHIWAASADVRLNSGGGIASARASLLVGVHGRLRRTLERELWWTPPPRSLVGAKFASAVLRKQAVLWSDSLQLTPRLPHTPLSFVRLHFSVSAVQRAFRRQSASVTVRRCGLWAPTLSHHPYVPIDYFSWGVNILFKWPPLSAHS